MKDLCLMLFIAFKMSFRVSEPREMLTLFVPERFGFTSRNSSIVDIMLFLFFLLSFRFWYSMRYRFACI